ncbi:MAG: hypothetical protein ABSF67_03575 [Roseiarcus sp.]
MTLDIEDRVFAIVDRSERPLDEQSIAEALVEDMEEMIKSALDKLVSEHRITKKRGSGPNVYMYERTPR